MSEAMSHEVVRREVLLPASREDVWAALTRAEQLSEWFEADVRIDARPRGSVTAVHLDGTVRRGTVLAANPPFRLVVLWGETLGGSGVELGPSRMEFTLQAVREGTLLTVIESPLDPSSAAERLLQEVAR